MRGEPKYPIYIQYIKQPIQERKRIKAVLYAVTCINKGLIVKTRINT